MPTDGLTFAALVTPAGIAGAAALTTSAIALLKAILPTIAARISGALMAFIGTAILFTLGALATGVPTPDAGLLWFVSWITCATAAVGVHSATTHAIASAKA